MFKRLRKLVRNWFADKNCRVQYTFIFSNVLYGVVIGLALAQVEIATPVGFVLGDLCCISGFTVCVTLVSLMVASVDKHLVKVGESMSV